MPPSEMPSHAETSTKQVEVLPELPGPALSPDKEPKTPHRRPSERWGHQLADRLLIFLIIAVALYMLLSHL